MRERSKDLRVRRTIASIRKSFFELVIERDYNDISITDLTERAGINRKTFYLHYAGLEDLVREIEEEVIEEILKTVGPAAEAMDLKGCISNFYDYMENCNDITKKLMTNENYSFFYNDVTNDILKSDSFSQFFLKTDYPQIVRSYTIAITYIYRDWVKAKRPVAFNVLVDQAALLIEKGYSGVMKNR